MEGNSKILRHSFGSPPPTLSLDNHSQEDSDDGDVEKTTPNLWLLAPLPGASAAAATAHADEVDGHQDEDTHTYQDGHTGPNDDSLGFGGR